MGRTNPSAANNTAAFSQLQAENDALKKENRDLCQWRAKKSGGGRSRICLPGSYERSVCGGFFDARFEHAFPMATSITVNRMTRPVMSHLLTSKGSPQIPNR